MAFKWIGKSSDGNTVVLKKLSPEMFQFPIYATESWLKHNEDLVRRALILDVETTGLNSEQDKIIEIGIRSFLFNKQNGDILKLEESYSSFQDPQEKLRPEIVNLTGITDEMLEGQSIDWQKVDELFEKSQLIIAHNAKFDRPFVEKWSLKSSDKIWGCSLKQIDWTAKGYFSSKLELLNIYHGFFVDAHRAIHDVDALLYLLSLAADESQTKNYFSEVMENARKQSTQVIATGTRFETKDFLKSRGYSWDNTNKFWYRFVYKEELKGELTWLEENIYHGPFMGFTRDIPLQNTFK